MAYVNTSRGMTASFADRISAALKWANDAMTRRRIYRQTLRELSALSSRELNDLGIHRSMITRIALEAAYGK